MSFARTFLLLSLVSLSILGCGTIRISAYPDPAPDMQGYRTYSWMSRATPPPDRDRAAIASLDARVRAAVDANLSLKGYLQRSLSVPDFLVGYRAVTQLKTTESLRELYDYRLAGGGKAVQDSCARGFEEASLTLEIIDTKTRHILWRASAVSVVGEKRGGDRVAEAVRLMLEKLPHAQ